MTPALAEEFFLQTRVSSRDADGLEGLGNSLEFGKNTARLSISGAAKEHQHQRNTGFHLQLGSNGIPVGRAIERGIHGSPGGDHLRGGDAGGCKLCGGLSRGGDEKIHFRLRPGLLNVYSGGSAHEAKPCMGVALVKRYQLAHAYLGGHHDVGVKVAKKPEEGPSAPVVEP
jgi:hypothetical protein